MEWALVLLAGSMLYNYFVTIAWVSEIRKNKELEGMRKELESLYKQIGRIAGKKPKFLQGRE